jgi:hypothetical protein
VQKTALEASFLGHKVEGRRHRSHQLFCQLGLSDAAAAHWTYHLKSCSLFDTIF